MVGVYPFLRQKQFVIMAKQHITIEEVKEDLRYLRLLARDFPTVSSVTTEIINLEAILHLPKPTEHFLADVHGEHEAFQHILRNASGNIKRKVNDLFGDTITAEEKKAWIATQSGVTVGSDAFFPFGDNVERARKSGVQYIAEPGGSIRDDLVIEECDKHGIVMAFTGMRLFHH